MRHLALKIQHRNKEIHNGFLILLLVIFALFLSRAHGFNNVGGTAGPDRNAVVQQEEISSFNKITLGLPVSINMETEEGLTAVPGIGPVTAKSIVKERTTRGGFKTLEELRSVRGIGDKTYNKIKTYVTL